MGEGILIDTGGVECCCEPPPTISCAELDCDTCPPDVSYSVDFSCGATTCTGSATIQASHGANQCAFVGATFISPLLCTNPNWTQLSASWGSSNVLCAGIPSPTHWSWAGLSFEVFVQFTDGGTASLLFTMATTGGPAITDPNNCDPSGSYPFGGICTGQTTSTGSVTI